MPDTAAIEDFAVIEAEGGLELRMWIAPPLMAALEKRRRRAGRGDRVRHVRAGEPRGGFAAGAARAGGGCFRAGGDFAGDRESRAGTGIEPGDAGGACGWVLDRRRRAGWHCARMSARHNALDKLYGALATGGRAASGGIIVLTSRISIELVQKASRMGAAIVVAVSAPTALAVRAAEASGLTLVGVARGDGFEVFSGGWRIDRAQ